MPDVHHCFYDGKGTHDVFVLGNLLAEEYENFDEKKDFDEDHLKSLLECLAQLHGTGEDTILKFTHTYCQDVYIHNLIPLDF